MRILRIYDEKHSDYDELEIQQNLEHVQYH